MVQQQTVRSGLASYALVTVFVIAAAAIFLYFSHVSSTLADIGDLMVERKNAWVEITRYGERLVSFDENQRMPERIIVRMQARLAELLKADEQLRDELNERIDQLDQFPFSHLYAKSIANIKTQDIPASVRNYLTTLSKSPVTLVGARYSSLALPDAIMFASRQAMLPLDQQDQALRAIRMDISEKRAPVERTIAVILLVAVWTSWFALLRPSLIHSFELQHQITKSEQQARTTLSSIGEAVIVADATGRIQMLNPAAETLIAAPDGCAIDSPLSRLLDRNGKATGNAHEFPVDDVLTTTHVIKRRIQMPPLEGASNERHVDLTAAPLTNPSGANNGVVLVLRDITDELKIREQLRNSEKSRALSALAGGLAHEFNNTLAVITGANDLLQIKIARSPGNDGSMQRYIDSIRSAVKHSSALTSQLLAIGSKSGFELTPIDVLAPVTEVVDILRRTTDRSIEITLKVETDENQRFTKGNQASLQSAFLNFGLNSINAIVPPGKILVTIQQAQLTVSNQPASDNSAGDYIKVQWSDTGQGIPPENLGKIFEPFYTTRTELGGIGLGLSVARSIIHEHNGSVTAASEPGVGTTLTVHLPCTTERPATVAPPQPTNATGTGQLVLLAEDETRTAELMAEILTSNGFEVLIAHNGREALELYRTHRKQIDIAILDINLPLMPGHKVAHAILKLDPQCAIIISTGYLEASVGRSLQSDGIKTILKKPYPAQQLLAEIARLQPQSHQTAAREGSPGPSSRS